VQARGVRVKLKRTDFRILTRQRVLPQPTDVAADLFAAAQTLLEEFDDTGPFRLVGLAAYDLVDVETDAQLALPLVASDRNRRLETTLDRLTERYGTRVVQRAAELIGDRGVGVGANLDFLADREGEDP
jgi:DNA polymerase-4